MIDYHPGTFAVSFVWRLHGSVFPRALFWAIPSAALAYGVAYLRNKSDGDHRDFEIPESGIGTLATLWTTYSATLGFLLVFRTQQAYGRYIEGASLLRDMRSEWLNAVSSLNAFSSRAKVMRPQVERFRHHLVRLVSLMCCCTLQSMADTEYDCLPVIDLEGLDMSSIAFLQSKVSKSQRSEIVMQWIQRLVIEQSDIGVINVPAPILTPFFQEMARGAVAAAEARNLTDIPFPFPYAQMLTVMLMIHAFFSPVICTAILQNEIWACTFTFMSVLAFWGTNYIAVELESPFGDDANDLPLVNIQQDMNTSLWIQLERQTHEVPRFDFVPKINRKWGVSMVGSPTPGMHLDAFSSLLCVDSSEFDPEASQATRNSSGLDSPTRMRSTRSTSSRGSKRRLFTSGASWLGTGALPELRHGDLHEASSSRSFDGSQRASKISSSSATLRKSSSCRSLSSIALDRRRSFTSVQTTSSGVSVISFPDWRATILGGRVSRKSTSQHQHETVRIEQSEAHIRREVCDDRMNDLTVSDSDDDEMDAGTQGSDSEGLPTIPEVGIQFEKPWRLAPMSETVLDVAPGPERPTLEIGETRSQSATTHNAVSPRTPQSSPRLDTTSEGSVTSRGTLRSPD